MSAATFSTVRSRRLAPRLSRQSAHDLEQLKQLSTSCWQVRFMGALWSVQMTNVRQLDRQRQLLKKLVRHCLDELPEYRHFKVDVKVADAVADPEADVPCLSVTVTDGDSRAASCQLLLCSVAGMDRLLPVSCHDKCVWLPLMLCRGPAAIQEAICTRMRVVFGSSSTCPGFGQDDLRWMAAMWSDGEESRPVVFEYSAPESVASAGLATISLEIPNQQIQLVWASVHRPSERELSREQMLLFHRLLDNMVMNTMGLPLSTFQLSRISTSLATVQANGRIKFTSQAAMGRCLTFLRQLAYEFYDIYM